MSVKTWLERHAQTLVGSLGRLSQQPLATLMTVTVIGIALALPLLLGVFLNNARTATAHWNQTFDMTVYLQKKVTASRTQVLAKQLRARPEVARVSIITAADALAQFRSASGFGDALDALEENPLPDALVVTPTLGASTPEGMAELESAIRAEPDVQSVQVDTAWVKRVQAMLGVLRRIVWLTGGLLALGVVLVIGNTIRLDILNRRAEIEVMKLVGATDGFARRPFLYTGIWYGLGGGFVAILLVEIAVLLLAAPVARLAGVYGSPFRFLGLGFAEAGMLLAAALGLGWIGSWLAATRHIRGIEPS
jgi:cell division transport system permease protein